MPIRSEIALTGEADHKGTKRLAPPPATRSCQRIEGGMQSRCIGRFHKRLLPVDRSENYGFGPGFRIIGATRQVTPDALAGFRGEAFWKGIVDAYDATFNEVVDLIVGKHWRLGVHFRLTHPLRDGSRDFSGVMHLCV